MAASDGAAHDPRVALYWQSTATEADRRRGGLQIAVLLPVRRLRAGAAWRQILAVSYRSARQNFMRFDGLCDGDPEGSWLITVQ